MNFEMRTRPGGLLRALLVTGAFVAVAASAANSPPAAYNNTASGTSVSNTATVNYNVASIAQTAITSTATTFTVDRRIDVFVTEVSAGAHSVTPGQTSFTTATAASFYVTNLGNDTQDIAVTASNRADGTDDDFALTGTDLFDVTAPFLYYQDDGDNVFEPGTDDAALQTEGGQAYLDQVAKDTTRRVWVIPTSVPTVAGDADATNGNFALILLTAQVYTAGTGATDLGVAEVEDTGADVQNGAAQNVFTDAAGETDAARDGIHTDDDAFLIASAVISITKSSVVVSDPFNLAVNPKRIPGATVRYTITVANAASASSTADPVIISDAMPANVTYVAGTLYESADATCNTSDTLLTDADDTDRGNFTAGTATFGDTTGGTDLALAPNTARSYCYDVTIN